MRSFLFAVVVLAQLTAFAAANKEACKVKAQKQNELNVISSNIANINSKPDLDVDSEIQKMAEATKAYDLAVVDCPLTSDEACEAAAEKKATYNFLVKKLSKVSADPELNIAELINGIKKTGQDYKTLNSQCKR